MDLATLVMAQVSLAERSTRRAARLVGRPPSTVATALVRLESALAVDLARRAGAGLAETLEARRIAPVLAAIRLLAERIAGSEGSSGDGLHQTAACAVSMVLLARFVETVRAGSIRRAAMALGVGQPQLTRQLRHLETVLGAPLLARGINGSAPTDRGRAVYEAALEVLTHWAELSGGARLQYQRDRRTVRVGSILPLGHESRIAQLLADVLAAWSSERRHHHLALTSATAEDLVGGLKSGTLDVAILDADAGEAGLEGRPLRGSRLALVGRPGFSRDRLPAAVLMTEKVAVPSRRSGLRQTVMRLMGPQAPGERTPPNFVEVDSIPVIVNLVIRHGYVTVLPLASTKALPAPLERIELPDSYDLPLWIAWQPTADARRVGLDLLALLEVADREGVG